MTEAIDTLVTQLKELNESERIAAMREIQQALHEVNPFTDQPVSEVSWVPIDKVSPNDYNPNAVAKKEMGLLYVSIKHDGYTQPVVTVYDETLDKYVIVDGFHRYFVCKSCPDIRERNHGYLPVVVIHKDINERMAATVRHNRARGAHSIDGMSNIVFNMLSEGVSDADICNELGMEAEELLKLKYITGYAKLYENTQYNKAWPPQMIMLEKKEQTSENNRHDNGMASYIATQGGVPRYYCCYR